MVVIRIWDTGYVNPEYEVSETAFPLYSSATSTQKEKGQFRVTSTPTELKLTSINFGQGNNIQKTPSFGSIKGFSKRTSTSAFSLSLNGYIRVPNNYANITDKKDLETIYDFLILGAYSKGHKDLTIVDPSVATRVELFSLYHLINRFGKTEVTQAQGYKHLNIDIESIDYKENVAEGIIDVSISCTVFPYIE